jgi:hypothetical protein
MSSRVSPALGTDFGRDSTTSLNEKDIFRRWVNGLTIYLGLFVLPRNLAVVTTSIGHIFALTPVRFLPPGTVHENFFCKQTKVHQNSYPKLLSISRRWRWRLFVPMQRYLHLLHFRLYLPVKSLRWLGYSVCLFTCSPTNGHQQPPTKRDCILSVVSVQTMASVSG